MEFLLNVNGAVQYINLKECVWVEYRFNDEDKSVEVWGLEIYPGQVVGNPVRPIYRYELGDAYEQVKFSFQNYLPRVGRSLDITEVWDDRERVLRQSAEVLQLSKEESDVQIDERRVNLEIAKLRLENAKNNLEVQKRMGYTEEIISGGGRILN